MIKTTFLKLFYHRKYWSYDIEQKTKFFIILPAFFYNDFYFDKINIVKDIFEEIVFSIFLKLQSFLS